MKSIKYFRLSPSTDEAEVGAWPQIIDVAGITRETIGAFNKLRKTDKMPLEFPRLDAFVLHNSALITDVFSCKFIPVHIGIIVNSRLKLLIENHELEKVTVKGIGFSPKIRSLEYYFLFAFPAYELISFPDSVFVEKTIGGTKLIGEHKFQSAEDFRANYVNVRSSPTNSLRAASVRLKREADFFRLPSDFDSLHISAWLAEALNKEKITGAAISESEIKFSIE